MIFFRLSKEKYKYDLSGQGAAIANGRWNSKGIAVLYTSISRALCVLEVLVHKTSAELSDDFCLVTIEVPNGVIIPTVQIQNLPSEWSKPSPPRSLQNVGDSFINDNKYLGLSVPSAVVQRDRNILINPKHPEFSTVKVIDIEPFKFDQRLIGLGMNQK